MYRRPGYVYVWKRSEDKRGGGLYSCLGSFFAHKGVDGCTSLLPDPSGTLLTGGGDGQVKRWNISSPDKATMEESWVVCRPERPSVGLVGHVTHRPTPFPKDPNCKSVRQLVSKATLLTNPNPNPNPNPTQPLADAKGVVVRQ